MQVSLQTSNARIPCRKSVSSFPENKTTITNIGAILKAMRFSFCSEGAREEIYQEGQEVKQCHDRNDCVVQFADSSLFCLRYNPFFYSVPSFSQGVLFEEVEGIWFRILESLLHLQIGASED